MNPTEVLQTSLRRTLVLQKHRLTVNRRLSTAVRNAEVSDTTGEAMKSKSW